MTGDKLNNDTSFANEKLADTLIKEANESTDSRSFNFATITLIAEMARKGIIPNGNFSDAECNLWCEFRQQFRDVANNGFNDI